MTHPQEQLERKFGELAVEFGYLSSETLYHALRQQSRLQQQQGRFIPLGELLCRNGALTAEQARRILGLQTGCQRVGQYRLIRKLGAGGMGSVYEARQELLNRPVALKILASHIANNPTAVAQFHREAQLVAKLDHPNIVAGIDVGVDQGCHYFAMELVAGDNLAHALLAGKRLRVDKALHILREVAQGLAHAHSRGVIHRDIKPGNILIYQAGESGGLPRVKLTDLGLAQTRLLTAEDRRNNGWNMGTPHYFAPEQARGEHSQDFRVDIYALGMTFYRLLSGREPFEGMPYYAIRDAHLTATLINPADQLHEFLPDGVTQVMRRMTAKRALDRYDSYAALLTDLTALVENRAVETPPLAADQATVRPPLEVFKLGGSHRRLGLLPTGTTVTPGTRPSKLAQLNGHAHLAKVPSCFLERYHEGTDPKRRLRTNILPVRSPGGGGGSVATPVSGLAPGALTPSKPLVPVAAGSRNPAAPSVPPAGTPPTSRPAAGPQADSAHKSSHPKGLSGLRPAAKKTTARRPRRNANSGSAVVPTWLKLLIGQREEEPGGKDSV